MKPRQAQGWGGAKVAALRKRWKTKHVYAFGTVESTNDVARGLADEGTPSGTIVVARTQRAGRGRGRARWHSPPDGGVYLSMVFRPGPGTVPPLVSVLAGVGIAEALESAFPDLGPALKWPNDLMAGGKKLGGILAESSAAEDGSAQLVVGVGINVRAAKLPRSLPGATAVDAHEPEAGLVDVADAVVGGLRRRLSGTLGPLDPATLRELDRLDWLRNKRVRHVLPEADPVVGVAAGIAPDGALLLRPDRGALRRVVAGSIELLTRG